MTGPTAFEAQLADGRAPISADLGDESRMLLIAFGGLNGGMQIPPFEFFQVTRGIPAKRIFLRDLDQSWYHRGLPGIADRIDGVTAYLRRELTALRPRRLVVCGNSMGGYAALLFGSRLEADVVLAFCPQTFIDPLRRFLYRDRRYREQIGRVHRSPAADRRLFDLRRVLRREASRKTVHHIYYGEREPMDAAHARRMRGLPNVVLHRHATGGHDLVRSLRDSGRLREILLAAFEGLPAPGAGEEPRCGRS